MVFFQLFLQSENEVEFVEDDDVDLSDISDLEVSVYSSISSQAFFVTERLALNLLHCSF